ncbi:alpha/beta hydrolase [Candidatus Bathyarchaeota archaeon]|nr:alpha/beta hydrolase [Candidatus Bathyarchaeota archaeon]
MLVEKRFDTGSSIINYAEGPDSGPPLIFLHGLTDRWQFFLPILPFLSNRWHVYALDFRGHGKSSRSPPYRYIDHMNDIVKFIESVTDEKPVIFGASLGGNIALMAASKHPEIAHAIIFADGSIHRRNAKDVMVNYHSYWAGWEKIAGSNCSMEEMVRRVAEMPINISWRPHAKYGDGMDSISLLNKATNLKHVDPRVLTPYALGGSDDTVFEELTQGYDEEEIWKINCPILVIQGNTEKGGILTDESVAFIKERARNVTHVYLPEYDHNLGCYSYETASLLRVTTTFLESLL